MFNILTIQKKCSQYLPNSKKLYHQSFSPTLKSKRKERDNKKSTHLTWNFWQLFCI